MNRRISTIVAAFILALPVALASSGAPGAQENGDCVSARQAQQAVEAGEIMELPDAARRAGVEQKYIGDARLCDVGGSQHWVVNVMSEDGESERIVLNAEGE